MDRSDILLPKGQVLNNGDSPRFLFLDVSILLSKGHGIDNDNYNSNHNCFFL